MRNFNFDHLAMVRPSNSRDIAVILNEVLDELFAVNQNLETFIETQALLNLVSKP